MSVLQNPIAAASGSAAPTGYQIERSLRFNSADSAVLSRTFPTAGSKTTWTYSTWIKRSALYNGLDLGIFATMPSPQQNRLHFMSGDKIVFLAYNGGGFVFQIQTSQVFRDVGAWFHLVAVVDSTNATTSERIRLYVNGARITALDVATYPSQNADCLFNGATLHEIGGYGGGNYYNGYYAETHFVDGQALDPTYFGESNSNTGVWSPIAYTGAYGTNGFYLPFNDNSSVVSLGRNRQELTADPYFNSTTLLLNTSSTNGAQNNTFLDSSTNNFTITRNGNTTQGTFTPFSQTGWSNYFSASPFLTVASNAAFDFGSGDATQEMWVYPTAASQTGGLFDKRSAGANYSQFPQITIESGVLKVYVSYTGSSWAVQITGATPTPNTWTHIALVRSGNTWTLYVNGAVSGTPVTASGSVYASTSSLCIGAAATDGSNPYAGYISNVRIVKGTAVYTSAFTPPTAPLTAISGTSLLTCQSNRFLDNSTNAFAITVNGTPSVQAFSPFAPAAGYDPAVVGGSGYFDGSGDYLTVPDNAAYDLSGDFTLELWAYMNDFASSGAAPSFISGTNSSNNWLFFVTAANEVIFMFNTGIVINGTATSTVKEWAHYALCRSGSTLRVFKNGVLLTSVTNTTNFTISNSVLYFGVQNGSNGFINGYMSGLRLVNGTALYTAAFTPPTAPPTAITNTKLLLNFTNSGIYDSTSKSTWETVGNVQVSTAQSKWGGTSIYVPGSSTNQRLLPSQNYPLDVFGTGDFTLECWLYVISQGATAVGGLWDQRPGVNGTYINWVVDFGGYGQGSSSNPKLVLYTNSSVLYASGVLTMGTWNHVALCRANGTTRMFINGTLSGTAVSDTNNYLGGGSAGNYRPSIGSTDGGDSLYGYIDDFRATRFARYTGNFSVPTAPFAYNQADINVKQWTPNNFSVTAGVGNDSLVDSPTNYGTDTGAGGEVRGNYCTLNPLDTSTALSNGSLDFVTGNGNYGVRSNFEFPSSGKWYLECILSTSTSGSVGEAFGFANSSASLTSGPNAANKWIIYADSAGSIYSNGTTLTSGLGTFASGTVLQVAYDGSTGNAWVGKNNTWYNSSGGTTGNPSTGANPTFTSLSNVFAYLHGINATQNFNAGQRPFAYTAPSGFKALCTQNLPTPAIGATSSTLAGKQMNAVNWTGTGTTQNVTGVGFQPDLVWIKRRNGADNHSIFDAVRGTGKYISSNLTNAEATDNSSLTTFGADGFTSGGSVIGGNGFSYVAWNWKENATAGIDVTIATANSSAVLTYSHSLGVSPSFIISKSRSAASTPWIVYHKDLGVNKYLLLNTTDAATTLSGLFTLSSSQIVINSQTANATYVAYAFAEVAGFSKFGSYTGNGSTDGPFVYCGFRPKFILVKNHDAGTEIWAMLDSARDTYNVVNRRLYANTTNAENTGDSTVVDFLSNGFKLRSTDAATNASRGYVFAAFAEHPFNYARAR